MGVKCVHTPSVFFSNSSPPCERVSRWSQTLNREREQWVGGSSNGGSVRQALLSNAWLGRHSGIGICEGCWEIGYLVDGQFVTQDEALECIYYRSYEAHFRNHPEDLTELITLAKELHNPHAAATTSVDLQTPAILEYLHRHDLTLHGKELVDIGSWNGHASHAISVRGSRHSRTCYRRPENDAGAVLARRKVSGDLV